MRLDKKYNNYDEWLLNFSDTALVGKWFHLESVDEFKARVKEMMVDDGVEHKVAATSSFADALKYAMDADNLPRRKIRERIKELTKGGEDDTEWYCERKMV